MNIDALVTAPYDCSQTAHESRREQGYCSALVQTERGYLRIRLARM
jgi:hypothetical protein